MNFEAEGIIIHSLSHPPFQLEGGGAAVCFTYGAAALCAIERTVAGYVQSPLISDRVGLCIHCCLPRQ